MNGSEGYLLSDSVQRVELIGSVEIRKVLKERRCQRARRDEMF